MEFWEAFIRGVAFGIGWLLADKLRDVFKSKKVKGQA